MRIRVGTNARNFCAVIGVAVLAAVASTAVAWGVASSSRAEETTKPPTGPAVSSSSDPGAALLYWTPERMQQAIPE